ncbi:TetR/AcrR family transcriptional regulator C-terminal domain-containing protein [Salinibacterium sp. ZJ70]|uniref:TetR/AcrR family transcriptional regulator C-terminal domain-containing protein n=1 Tax=Salinibacterium sp. ZJ70 TaxID=2708084 RepID=UPI00141DD935|nr:TetR/AcrR family transcriptional regulator C-terminal domain-containing protein [Salinibacterium sp. ZJ70]
MAARTPLTRSGIVDAAVAVADANGLDGVSMRSVGKQLGVEAMSLYHHIEGKEQLLDELADWVFAHIRMPSPEASWRDGMADRSRSARDVLSAHPWGLALVESRRNPGPILLAHHNAVLGCFRRGGFSVRLAAHAFSVIDSYVYGFVYTEQRLPFEADEPAEDFATGLALAAEHYPHMVEMVTEMMVGQHYAYGDEFEYGLGLILDALESRLADEQRAAASDPRLAVD